LNAPQVPQRADPGRPLGRPPDIEPDFLEHVHRERIERAELSWERKLTSRLCEGSMLDGIGDGVTMPGAPRRIRLTLNEVGRSVIVRSRAVLLALSAVLGAVIATPGAWSTTITRGGQPAELTVTSAGAHSVRVTLLPVGVALPPSPSLLNLEIKNPLI